MHFSPCKTHDEGWFLFPHTPTSIAYHSYAFMRSNADNQIRFSPSHPKIQRQEVHGKRSLKATSDVTEYNTHILSVSCFNLEARKHQCLSVSFLQRRRHRSLNSQLESHSLTPMSGEESQGIFAKSNLAVLPVVSFSKEKMAGVVAKSETIDINAEPPCLLIG